MVFQSSGHSHVVIKGTVPARNCIIRSTKLSTGLWPSGHEPEVESAIKMNQLVHYLSVRAHQKNKKQNKTVYPQPGITDQFMAVCMALKLWSPD